MTEPRNKRYEYLCRVLQESPDVVKHFVEQHFPPPKAPGPQPTGPTHISYTIFKEPTTAQWGIRSFTTRGNVVVDTAIVGPLGARGIQVLKLQRMVERMRGAQ